ncbi:sensor histidine kinase [Actinomadura sp. SCN-SB]|uniref:sensor histidine kinase n=1 Tax=Actinomadura sp. SCN-SB TaxID=3373092 RepID=UPI0037514DA3
MRDRPAPLRLLSLSVAIVATSLLTTGAWAMDTFLPGAVVGAGLCLLLLTPLLWSLRRSAKRRRDAVQRFEARLSEVAESGWGLRVPPPGAADRGGGEIARLTRTVNGMLDREERTMARQRQFAADASHELRTPIAGLRTKIEVALADPEEVDPVGTLKDALRDVERLHQIAEDLLALARIDVGARPERAPLDLTGLVRDEVAARTSAVPLRSGLRDGVLVEGNRPQIVRALVNLLNNAERYAEREITVSLGTEGREAVLEVRDDGPGIAVGDRERVFDPFARLDSARSRDSGGSGLGLPVAREIVTAHGGRLNVADSDRGARLVLRLPLYRPRERGEQAEEDDPERGERATFRPPMRATPRPEGSG